MRVSVVRRIGIVSLLLLAAATAVLIYSRSGMPTENFSDGLRYEIANRAFAIRVVSRLAERYRDTEQEKFWVAYVKLERFSAPLYRSVAERWNIDPNPGWWTRFRAAAVGSVPKLLMVNTLRSMLTRTEDYVEKLRQLQSVGPVKEKDFLDYMIAQELLQVEMMKLALSGRYGDISSAVEAFVDDHMPSTIEPNVPVAN